MAHLPPVGWADVATKHDPDQLGVSFEERVRAEIQSAKFEFLAMFGPELHTEIHGLHSEIRSALRWGLLFTSSLMISLAGIGFAAARLT